MTQNNNCTAVSACLKAKFRAMYSIKHSDSSNKIVEFYVRKLISYVII